MTTPASARHKRGCNCKRSKCTKKYCECFQVVYILYISICSKYFFSFTVSAKSLYFEIFVKRLMLDAQVDADVTDVRMSLARKKVRTHSMNSYYKFLMHHKIQLLSG